MREYPLGEAAAHLIGYVQSVTEEDLEEHAGEGYTANSVIGKSGMEGLFESELKVQNGCRIYIENSEGREKEELAYILVQHGQDMYDILYPKVNGQYVPYVADDNLSVGAVYRISKKKFESVIMKYFNIDSETLQSKTVYDSENSTYEYKPRGFEEVEYPEYPYSEVIGYTENSDGTITLTANVVFPYSGNSKVYAHEVVVRPLEDGGVQYVSNRIIPSEDNSEETWHTPRLTLEEWEELYGGE